MNVEISFPLHRPPFLSMVDVYNNGFTGFSGVGPTESSARVPRISDTDNPKSFLTATPPSHTHMLPAHSSIQYNR